MSKIREAIREFAKDLYTQFDKEGERKFSSREIADKVFQNFNKKVTHVTVLRWAKDDDWDGINQKIKQFAIEKAHEDDKFTPDEKVIDAKGRDLAEVYKYGKLMAQIGTDVLQTAYKVGKGDKAVLKNSEISVKEAISAMRTGSNIILRLNDVPDPESTGAGIIIMPDNKR